MNVELQMLVLVSLLTVALSLVGAGALMVYSGIPYAAGNRDSPTTLPPWAQRAERAYRNSLDNLLPFAALVLVAQVAGVSNEATAWGATVFFWGRLAHAGIYIAGIPYLRTVAFVIAFGGMFDIVRALFGAWSAVPLG